VKDPTSSQHPMAMTILGCLWLVWFWTALLRVALPVVLPYVEAELGISHAASGLLMTAQLGAIAAVSVPAGFAVRRFGARAVLVACVGCACALSLAVAAAQTYGSLVAVFAGMGVALGLYFPVGVAVLSSVFPPGRFGRVMGLHDIAPPAASVIGPAILSAVVLGRLEWRMAFETMMPIGVVLAIALWWVIPGRPSGPPPRPADGLHSLRGKRRGLLLLLAPHALNAACGVGALSMLPIFLVSTYGLTGQQAAAVLAGVSLGGVLGPPVGGWLSDRWSRLGTPALYLGLSCACVLAVVALPLGPITYAALFLLSLTTLGYYPLTFTILAQQVSLQARAPVNGLFQGTSVLAAAVSPSVIGALGEALSLRVGYLFCVAAAVAGLAVLIWLMHAEKGASGRS